MARSRRPSHRFKSGAASSAAISVAVRNDTIRLVNRFGGIARTRWISSACSGWWRAAKENSDRIAVSRTLRVRTLLCRSVSRWLRNAVIEAASRSSQSSRVGSFPLRWWVKTTRSFSVSR